ncbi:MAG: MotA/TolQ/ExbB proton channel family protein [Planctomycetota bacterium]
MRWIVASVMLLVVFGLTVTTASISYANNDDIAAELEEAGGDPAPENEPAPNNEPAGDDGGDAPKEKTNLLSWVIKSLGFGYLGIFLALSVTLVSLFVMNMLAARRDTLCPQELVDTFEEKLNEKDFQSAYDMARTDESVLGQVLSAGLAKLSRGYNKAIEGMQEVGEEESMKLEHRLSYMALIGNLSPMIGLFGTVHGMIDSFQVIAISQATPKPAELAEGISTALFTTLVGLAIAIPAIAAYNVIRNRVSRLLLEVGVTSENLMSRFEDVQPQGAKK